MHIISDPNFEAGSASFFKAAAALANGASPAFTRAVEILSKTNLLNQDPSNSFDPKAELNKIFSKSGITLGDSN